MRFVAAQAVRLALAILLAAVVLTGTIFAGCAGFLLLVRYVDPAAAAALVATVLLVPVFAGAIAIRLRARTTKAEAPAPTDAQAPDVQTAVIAAIAGFAEERPLLAIVAAGAAGLAAAFLKRKARND